MTIVTHNHKRPTFRQPFDRTLERPITAASTLSSVELKRIVAAMLG